MRTFITEDYLFQHGERSSGQRLEGFDFIVVADETLKFSQWHPGNEFYRVNFVVREAENFKFIEFDIFERRSKLNLVVI